MIRSTLSRMLMSSALVGLGFLPMACPSSGVGDPCTPEDEYNAGFSGFNLKEDGIESRSFQCQTRLCLANHFQGRVTCPMGQAAPKICAGPNDSGCPQGAKCEPSSVKSPACTVKTQDKDCFNLGGKCDPKGLFCACGSDDDCKTAGFAPDGVTPIYFCNKDTKQCTEYVCHDGSCQDADSSTDEDANKACCIPGTATPIGVGVCGQCAKESKRDAEDAVYCSCRCGVAEGEDADPDFNFCECPDGFECAQVRKSLGLGDEKITGKFCIRSGTTYEGEQLASCSVPDAATSGRPDTCQNN